jgi:hypothetical protein
MKAKVLGADGKTLETKLDEWLSEDSAQKRGCDKPREPQIHIKLLQVST